MEKPCESEKQGIPWGLLMPVQPEPKEGSREIPVKL